MIIKCPSCQQTLKIPDDAAGKTLRCGQCQQPFRAPAAPQADFDPLSSGSFDVHPASTPSSATRDKRSPGVAPQPQYRPVSPPTRPVTPRKKMHPALLAILVIGGVTLLSCLGLCGVVGMFFYQASQQMEAEHKRAAELRKQLPATLAEARRTHTPRFLSTDRDGTPVTPPPQGLFDVVQYPTPIGDMAAYVSPDPGDGQKHPVVIWIFGGFGNGIDETAWMPADPENDQSASAFREAGLLMMYPSLRGGNQNAGHFEGIYGEVDDVLAATDYVTSLDYVDTQRIYLGGHSTGGTLALMAAVASSRYRAVFSFGPVENVAFYGQGSVPFDVNDAREAVLRSPIYWLDNISSRTFVIEGVSGNHSSLVALRDASQNRQISFHSVRGKDHFSVLAPVTSLLARKIAADNGPTCTITLSDQELAP